MKGRRQLRRTIVDNRVGRGVDNKSILRRDPNGDHCVEDREEEVIVTRNGKPAAVLVNYDEYARLKDTLDVSLANRWL